jgi:hypothetical protein
MDAVITSQNFHPCALPSLHGLVCSIHSINNTVFLLTVISFVTCAAPADCWYNAHTMIAVLACAQPMLSALVV